MVHSILYSFNRTNLCTSHANVLHLNYMHIHFRRRFVSWIAVTDYIQNENRAFLPFKICILWTACLCVCVCELRACIGDSNAISSFNGYVYQKEVEKSMPFGINSLTYLNHTIRIAVEILNKSNKKKIYALYYHQ